MAAVLINVVNKLEAVDWQRSGKKQLCINYFNVVSSLHRSSNLISKSLLHVASLSNSDSIVGSSPSAASGDEMAGGVDATKGD